MTTQPQPAAAREAGTSAPAVLICAPGRDGRLASEMLERYGFRCVHCDGPEAMRAQLGDGTGALVLAEEALDGVTRTMLDDWLRRQPPWSDLPVVMVARGNDRGATPAMGTEVNASVLTRPMRPEELRSAISAALRARRRQYEVRDLLAELEDQNRRKDDFLAMLAHELRNPLAPVRFAAHGILREADGERLRRLAEVVERQVGHMASLIDELLDVSRLARGQMRIEPETLDFAEVVRQARESHRVTAEARGVRIELDAAAPVPVRGDRTRLAQLVENLLDNALKFTSPPGRVKLTVAAEGDAAVLQVEDDGAGIPAHLLAHLFEPLTQADRSLDRTGGGLGLGLTLVRGIAQLHGGTASAHSPGPGCGSRFEVRLPRAPAEDRERSLPSTAPSGDGLDAVDAAGRYILLAEDNRDAAATLQQLLELSGFQVQVAASGTEAVQAALRRRPDILLCDIGLPGLDGYGVARKLRARPGWDAVHMIALTGYGSEEDRNRAMEAGFDDHLAKPVAPDRLLRFLAAGRGETAS
ncbi:ATP-binding response regulator [Ramlibacter montanisoli]|uniref:histidine kinase n=1 Tax=Ramlibacter montanisoli TaxID=2732512 RepID=A0A849KAM9_9BURK|nr:response regulator [Ramlibacter montanisoli]NNU43464.1 response regulator [Ramlibacter montanisoli]